MPCFEVEIVAGAVEIDGEEIDPGKSVFLRVGLKLDEQHLLGETVGRVRFLGIAVSRGPPRGTEPA